jgi:hypothetical protein
MRRDAIIVGTPIEGNQIEVLSAINGGEAHRSFFDVHFNRVSELCGNTNVCETLNIEIYRP